MLTPSESLHAAALAFARYVCHLRAKQLNSLDVEGDPQADPYDPSRYFEESSDRLALHTLAVALATEFEGSPWPSLAPRFSALAMRAEPEEGFAFNFDHELSESVTLLAPVLGRRITSFRDLAEVAAGCNRSTERQMVEEWSEPVTDFIDAKASIEKLDQEQVSNENRPSDQRQSDIIAAIVAAGMPLQRDEILRALHQKTPGRFKDDLSWMVKRGILRNVKGLGYWLYDRDLPQ